MNIKIQNMKLYILLIIKFYLSESSRTRKLGNGNSKLKGKHTVPKFKIEFED